MATARAGTAAFSVLWLDNNSSGLIGILEPIKTAPEDPVRQGGDEWRRVFMGVQGASPAVSEYFMTYSG